MNWGNSENGFLAVDRVPTIDQQIQTVDVSLASCVLEVDQRFSGLFVRSEVKHLLLGLGFLLLRVCSQPDQVFHQSEVAVERSQMKWSVTLRILGVDDLSSDFCDFSIKFLFDLLELFRKEEVLHYYFQKGFRTVQRKKEKSNLIEC